MPRVLVACVFCLVLAANAAGETNWDAWVEEVRKQHPLAGSFYIARSDTLYPISAEMDGWSLPMVLGKHSGFVLLGEVHDNPVHHQLRAWLLRAWRLDLHGLRSGIVFEQIRADQTTALGQFKVLTEAGSGTSDELFKLLEWDKSGWPPAQIYKPLFEAALASKLPIYAGDPPQGRVRSVARAGFSSVPPEERSRLRLDEPMPAPLLDALRKELAGSHCGVLPVEAVEGMAAAQRYRDAHLADALLSAAERYHEAAAEHYRDPPAPGLDPYFWRVIPQRPAILIAGNGHVRTDRGVPWYLRLRAPTVWAMTFLFVEVEEGKTDPKLYLPRDPEGKPAADMVIFTPKHLRPDPCEQMRRSKR